MMDNDGLVPVVETQDGLASIQAIFQRRWAAKFNEAERLMARVRVFLVDHEAVNNGASELIVAIDDWIGRRGETE